MLLQKANPVSLTRFQVAFGHGQWCAGKWWTAGSPGKIKQPTNHPTSQPWFAVLADLKLPEWYQLACKIYKNLKISSHQLLIAGSRIPQAGLCSFTFLSTELSKNEEALYTWNSWVLYVEKSGTFLVLLPRTACTCQCDYLFFIFNVWALGQYVFFMTYSWGWSAEVPENTAIH